VNGAPCPSEPFSFPSFPFGLLISLFVVRLFIIYGIYHAKIPPKIAPTVGPKTTPYKKSEGMVSWGCGLKLTVYVPYRLMVRFPSSGIIPKESQI
jgi:hypothetical protein